MPTSARFKALSGAGRPRRALGAEKALLQPPQADRARQPCDPALDLVRIVPQLHRLRHDHRRARSAGDDHAPMLACVGRWASCGERAATESAQPLHGCDMSGSEAALLAQLVRFLVRSFLVGLCRRVVGLAGGLDYLARILVLDRLRDLVVKVPIDAVRVLLFWFHRG